MLIIRSGSGVVDVGGRMEERAVNDIPEGVANAKQLAQSVVRVQNSLQASYKLFVILFISFSNINHLVAFIKI